jgi:cell division protease FtsH
VNRTEILAHSNPNRNLHLAKQDNSKPKSSKKRNRNPQSGDSDGSGFSNFGRNYIWIFLAILLAFWVFDYVQNGWQQGSSIEYSTFKTQVKQGNVDQVTVQGEEIQGKLKSPYTKTSGQESKQITQFITYMPSFGDDQLMDLLEKNNVQINAIPQRSSNWWDYLIWFLPLLFFIWIGAMFFRRMQGQGGQPFMNIGQSQAKRYEPKDEETTFDDVAGAEQAKVELSEVVDFLKNPEKFERIGGQIPKGVLMVGPPGTGKTLLARAVAGEAGVPFFTITGSDFMEMFVGVGAKRVREMFKQAKKEEPAIIFIDELDSIGRRRGAGLGGGHDEREQTLNQLLSELDGFEPNESIIVMAATNRPDILDKALLRPGRFDRRITVDSPSQNDRIEILKIHAKNKRISSEIDFEELARGTPGFSGADLKNLLNEAALIATRHEHDEIIQQDIEEARDKIIMGLERKGLIITDDERELLAYHEGGHAVVAAALPHADPVHKVTIVPRGKAMGVTQQLPEREQYIYRKEYMLDRLALMLGGRAAEDLIFDTATSGAENDLKQVTKLTRKMVLNWGMSDTFPNMAMGSEEEEVFLGKDLGQKRDYSEATARELDIAVKDIIDAAYKRAKSTLEEHREALDNLAKLLLEKEEVPGKAVTDFLEQEGKGAPANGNSQDQDSEEAEVDDEAEASA